MSNRRTGLLIVDIQAVTLSNCRTMPSEELLHAAATLLAAFRERGLPIWHVVSTGIPRGRTSYSEGTRTWTEEQAVIAPEVAPETGEPVVRRAAWSAFAGTRLAAQLVDADVETVVIAGLATPFGIESTARGAYDEGFSVIVVSDAVAGPDPQAHEHTLTRVVPALGRALTVATVLADPARNENENEDDNENKDER